MDKLLSAMEKPLLLALKTLVCRGRRSNPRPPAFETDCSGLQRIDDSHYDKIHFSLTAIHCFHNGYVEKQQVAWKEHCVKYWLKELHDSMDMCTGRRDITEILLKTALTLYLLMTTQEAFCGPCRSRSDCTERGLI